MVEHVIEQVGVTLGRHALVRRLEVAVVIAHKHGDAAGDRGVHLVGCLAPLLHRVVEEHVLEDVVGDLLELGVVLGTQLKDRHLAVEAELLNELGKQGLAALGAERHLERGVVERNRHERAVDVGKHAMLVVGEVGETRQVLVDALVIGVVDVRAVQVDEHPGLVEAIVGVARDVRTALEDADLLACTLRQLARNDRAGITGTDDEGVVIGNVERLGKTMDNGHVRSFANVMDTPAPQTTCQRENAQQTKTGIWLQS